MVSCVYDRRISGNRYPVDLTRVLVSEGLLTTFICNTQNFKLQHIKMNPDDTIFSWKWQSRCENEADCPSAPQQTPQLRLGVERSVLFTVWMSRIITNEGKDPALCCQCRGYPMFCLTQSNLKCLQGGLPVRSCLFVDRELYVPGMAIAIQARHPTRSSHRFYSRTQNVEMFLTPTVTESK